MHSFACSFTKRFVLVTQMKQTSEVSIGHNVVAVQMEAKPSLDRDFVNLQTGDGKMTLRLPLAAFPFIEPGLVVLVNIAATVVVQTPNGPGALLLPDVRSH